MNPFCRRRRRDDELGAEIQSHLDQAIRDRIDRGESPDEARASAMREFGNVGLVKEVTRETWGWTWLDRMRQDLRFGVRMLGKNLGFTITAASTLALGIGVNTALFTGFNSLLRPHGVRDPETVIRLESRQNPDGLFSYPEYLALRDRAQSIVEWAPEFYERFLLGETTAGVEPEEVSGAFVTEHYLSALGGRMQVGRFFTMDENTAPGRDAVVVLSHPFWLRRFAANPQIVGRTLLLNGKPFTVVGVTSPGFVGLRPEAPDFWTPLMMRSAAPTVFFEEVSAEKRDWFHGREFQWLSIYARLRPGRSLSEAQAELMTLFRQFPRAANRDERQEPQNELVLTPYSGRAWRRAGLRNSMALALGASGLVLLIACSNLANMLLARAAARQKEIGLRLALGASRMRVIRQLLTESLLLACLGGAAGVAAAWWSCELLLPYALAHSAGVDFARMSQSASPDGPTLIFALLLTFFSGLASGLAPALRATNPNLTAVLKNDSAAFGGRLAHSWLRSGLVIAQVALCLALLIPAGLLLRGLTQAATMDYGFETKKLLVVYYSLELSDYDEARTQLFNERLQERLRALPGVEKISRNYGFGGRATIVLPSEAGNGERRFEPAPFRRVSADYFDVIGTPLVKGRDFTPEEARTQAPVVIVSESTARRLWPNENPLGKTFRAERQLRNGDVIIDLPAALVIGVARDAQTVRVGEIPALYFYAPFVEKTYGMESAYLIRGARDAESLKALVRKTSLELEPVLRLDSFTMEEMIAVVGGVNEARAVSNLTTALGALALALAALGIHGLLTFAVAQRTREIGVRMALGASAHNVQALIVKQAMKLVTLGILFGAPLALSASHFLQGMLLGLSEVDPITYASMAFLLSIIALLACWIPARRATRIDPLLALRIV